MTVLTAHADNPTGYGRIIRKEAGDVQKIVEQKDANSQEAAVQEINTGTYCFDNELLFEALSQITTDNAQGEYYLTDALEILKNAGNKVAAYQTDDFEESLGVNDRVALETANQIMRKRINRQHMINGVTFVDAANTYIEADVTIGSDTVIEAGVILKGQTKIGQDCHITAHSEIVDSVIEDGVTIKHSVVEESIVRTGADVGPFAHLRPKADIGVNAHVGNFVEVKKATIGKDTKVGHLTYVGDATLGENINVGCGTIFANYDGKNKHHSTIGDNSFIGSGTIIVSPVNMEQNSATAAGSTITQDISEHTMAIARARQVNKENLAKTLPYFE